MNTFTYAMARSTALSADVQVAFDTILAKHVEKNANAIHYVLITALRNANGDCHRAIDVVRGEVAKLIDIFPAVDVTVFQECHAVVARLLRKIAHENRMNEISDVALNCLDAIIEDSYGRL